MEVESKEAVPENDTDSPAGYVSETGTAGDTTWYLSDDDCFSQASSGRSRYHGKDIERKLLEINKTIVKMLDIDDAELAGKVKVEAAKHRLHEAIDAEHLCQLQEHCDRFCGKRKSLHTQGAVIFGITVQAHELPGCFTLKRVDGGCFGENFSLRKRITLFRDFGEPAGATSRGSSACAATAATPSTTSQPQPADPPVLPSEAAIAPGQIDGEEVEPPGEGTGTPHETTAPPTSSSAAARDSLRDSVRDRFLELGIKREFDGRVIRRVKGDEIVIRTRNEFARRLVDQVNEEAGDGDDKAIGDADAVVSVKGTAPWALAGDLQDCTFRRQAAAAEALGTFLSVREECKATGRSVRRDDEVRLRKIILSDPAVAEDREFARSAAASGVEWLGAAAQRELEQALAAERLRLNREQLDALKNAAARSVTLLKGPPGTGKTHTLAAMAAALCQVFHNPNGTGDMAANPQEFELPSKKNMEDWNDEEVTRWIETFQNLELKQRAVKAMRGHTGKAVVDYKTKLLRSLLGCNTEDSSDDEEESPEEKERARALAEEFKRLRDATLESIPQCQNNEGRWATSFWRTSGRDMRIIVCADTNTAANRLLASLDALLPEGSSYSIVRMGVMDELTNGDGFEGNDLVQKYQIDCRRREHPLDQVRERLVLAMKRRELTIELAEELKRDILAFAERKRAEAHMQTHRTLVRENWQLLAESVENDVGPRVEGLIRQYMVSEPGLAREVARLALKNFQDELRTIVLQDIMIAVQVVVGTNTSIGELRDVCRKSNMSFPIVLMDEAGQSSEPSSLIPLSLGAEWALLGGDLAQLPPTLRSEEAREVLGFYTETGGSQYGRFAKLGVLELSLSRQYRMHPLIREFPSRRFYGNSLFEDPECMPDKHVPQPWLPARSKKCKCKGKCKEECKEKCKDYWWPSEKRGKGEFPLAFFDVSYGVERKERAGAYFNEQEASLAMQLLLAFACDPSVRSIVIITPYRAQASYINRRLDAGRPGLENKRRRGLFHATTFKAYTVDGFQGHEADVVIISTVRSNGSGCLGHVADERRLNVAITRAKRALLVVGNKSTFCSSLAGCPQKGGYNYWPELIKHIHDRGDAVVTGRETNEYCTLMAALPTEMACITTDYQKIKLVHATCTFGDYLATAKRKGKTSHK